MITYEITYTDARPTPTGRPHDRDRKDDRRLSTLRIRPRRPRHPPPLLRQPMGTRVRTQHVHTQLGLTLAWIAHRRSTIQAHLAAGTTVIADRYAFSGIAFSAQKSPHLNLTYEWCKAPEVGLPAPDLTLFLDVNPEVAMQRGGYGEERYEKQEVQARVQQIFTKIGGEMGKDRRVVIGAG